jgi:hypothetical protein
MRVGELPMTEQLADKKCVLHCGSILQNKERRLHSLEHDLIAAAKGSEIKLSVSQIRKRGLVAALRANARRP